MKICVFLSEDYTIYEIIDVDDSLSNEKIKEIIDAFFDIWYYCDFLTNEQTDLMKENNNETN